MTTLFIANDCTRESGSFCGDQLCSLKAAYLFVQHTEGVDKVVMSMSKFNEMNFLWDRFIDNPKGDGSIPKVQIVWEEWNPGDWVSRHGAWDQWRAQRSVDGVKFDHYKELYLRIHGALRQSALCGYERGLGRRNIYSYWWCGQEGCPEELPQSVDWFDDTLVYHPQREPLRDVYISPHCKTQGNYVFTFDYWARVVNRLLDSGITVTVGYDGYFYPEFNAHPNFKRHWGDHRQWMEQVCHHRLVACGNTGTGWLAAACGTPMITMEPHNSVMADHRYRECGLRNILEVIDGHKLDEFNNDMGRVADYCADRILELVRRRLVMTTGCYDILHAGHIRHLERARAMGTKLIVALNSDSSVSFLKGPERPINPQGQRRAVLEALRCVDEVRMFDGPNALHLIQELRPDVLACGYGYTVESIVGRGLVESWGGEVAVTCDGDGKNETSTTKIVNKVRAAELTEVVRAASAHSVNPPDKLRLVAEELLKVAHLPGDVVDLGAYRGGTSLLLNRLVPDKRLHIFDTWEGNPYNDELCHHKKGEWSCSMEECRKVVGNLIDVMYHKGVFPESVPESYTKEWDRSGFGPEFCFVYVDMDTYQATLDAIKFFLPRLVTGGRLLFDDYGWEPCSGVKKAVDECFPQEEYKYPHLMPGVPEKRIIQDKYTCVVRKR